MFKKLLGITLLILLSILAFNYNTAREMINSKFICPLPRQAGNAELFSQYFEDYILSMVLSDIENGTYVDAGANDPDKDSVTKYFYLKGWRGINIEPIEKWYQALKYSRPEDINLNYGISDKEGSLKFYRILHKDYESIDGLSTFDEKVLAQAVKDGFEYETYVIPLKTMNQVFLSHPMSHITFMKIDVEGFKEQVLKGMDLKLYRPDIFIIEATEPRTFTPAHEPWEPHLLSNNYEFVMFDGINRYYVAEEYYSKYIEGFKKSYSCVKVQNDKFKIIDSELFFKQ